MINPYTQHLLALLIPHLNNAVPAQIVFRLSKYFQKHSNLDIIEDENPFLGNPYLNSAYSFNTDFKITKHLIRNGETKYDSTTFSYEDNNLSLIKFQHGGLHTLHDIEYINIERVHTHFVYQNTKLNRMIFKVWDGHYISSNFGADNNAFIQELEFNESEQTGILYTKGSPGWKFNFANGLLLYAELSDQVIQLEYNKSFLISKWDSWKLKSLQSIHEVTEFEYKEGEIVVMKTLCPNESNLIRMKHNFDNDFKWTTCNVNINGKNHGKLHREIKNMTA